MKPKASHRSSSVGRGKRKATPTDRGAASTRIRVRLTPRSGRDAILAKEEGVYRVKIKAPPLEGRANRALIALLAKTLRVPKRDVEITAGEKSRDKALRIRGVTQEEVEKRLSQDRSA